MARLPIEFPLITKAYEFMLWGSGRMAKFPRDRLRQIVRQIV